MYPHKWIFRLASKQTKLIYRLYLNYYIYLKNFTPLAITHLDFQTEISSHLRDILNKEQRPRALVFARSPICENARAFGIYVTMLTFAFFSRVMGARSHKFRARFIPRLCRACPKRGEEFHERVRATFAWKGSPRSLTPRQAFLLLFPARGRGPLLFFLPSETSGRDRSLPVSLSLSLLAAGTTFGRACARVWPG